MLNTNWLYLKHNQFQSKHTKTSIKNKNKIFTVISPSLLSVIFLPQPQDREEKRNIEIPQPPLYSHGNCDCSGSSCSELELEPIPPLWHYLWFPALNHNDLLSYPKVQFTASNFPLLNKITSTKGISLSHHQQHDFSSLK